ncbi:MAG TPA: BCCT family transporter [Gemmatimonadaceae bacterium]|nr:BCCT family transporter [Gemmatimonadaceae bacterium]
MVRAASIAIVLLVVLVGALRPAEFAEGATAVLGATTRHFGWLYLTATFAFLLFALAVALSRYGTIRLGAEDEEPEYSNTSWFAMLFSAGMGIGLVFWGVAEPLSHFIDPPPGVPPRTPEAARVAMRYAFFHWGLHAWGIYAVLALALAYFSFRKGESGLISRTLVPLLGARARGGLGAVVDVLAVIATTFGVATSLGLGTLQINGGLARLTGLPGTLGVQIAIIGIVTVLYLGSAMSGLDRGIRILSNVNLLIACALLAFTLLVGPTSFIADTFTTTLGDYLQNLVQMSLRLTPFAGGKWIASWTLFYWAWWIAWAPFVGTFIARVSRGRTIREFILGVLVAPSLFGFLWFAVFGGTALHLELFRGAGLAAAAEKDITTALFLMLEQLPLGAVLSIVATLLIVTFFITSADSATFVLGMLTSDGNLNPSNRIKLTWGLLQSAIAAVLLAAGGLEGLQTASIVAAAPFAIIMLLICASLLRALRAEGRALRAAERERRRRIDALLEREAAVARASGASGASGAGSAG